MEITAVSPSLVTFFDSEELGSSVFNFLEREGF